MQEIEKILNRRWKDKTKIDALLEIDCALYTNLGTDSTKKEREEVKRKSRLIYKAIKTIDPMDGQRLLLTLDR